jgi:hypothetical protein
VAAAAPERCPTRCLHPLEESVDSQITFFKDHKVFKLILGGKDAPNRERCAACTCLNCGLIVSITPFKDRKVFKTWGVGDAEILAFPMRG